MYLNCVREAGPCAVELNLAALGWRAKKETASGYDPIPRVVKTDSLHVISACGNYENENACIMNVKLACICIRAGNSIAVSTFGM